VPLQNTMAGTETHTPAAASPRRLYSASQAPSLDAFKALCEQTATAAEYPLAASIERNIPIYALPAHHGTTTPAQRAALQDEWYRLLLHGPGVFVVRGLMSPFAHPLFTAMTGIGLGIAATTRSRRSTDNDRAIHASLLRQHGS